MSEYQYHEWQTIDRLLISYTPKVYDEVTSQLAQLKQLAEYQDKQDGFQARMKGLRERYKSRRSLVQRWDQKGL